MEVASALLMWGCCVYWCLAQDKTCPETPVLFFTFSIEDVASD
jgi:hypothetical protein